MIDATNRGLSRPEMVKWIEIALLPAHNFVILLHFLHSGESIHSLLANKTPSCFLVLTNQSEFMTQDLKGLSNAFVNVKSQPHSLRRDVPRVDSDISSRYGSQLQTRVRDVLLDDIRH